MAQTLLISVIVIRLNPYSNGICSMRDSTTMTFKQFIEVLILILMEYAL